MIRHLRTLRYGQAIRDDGPQSHLAKTGTPTMGGVLILTSIGVASLLWARLDNLLSLDFARGDGYLWRGRLG